MSERVGGILQVKVNGVQYRAKSTSFEYNIYPVKAESVIGIDGRHGIKEIPVVIYIQGAITDSADLDVKAFAALRNAVVTVSLNNGKVLTFKGADQTADLAQTTEEGEIPFRFEADFAEEV